MINPYAHFITSKQSPNTERITIDWLSLSPGATSFEPRTCSSEELFYVVSGQPHIVIDGSIYPLEAGNAIGFSALSGLFYSFINQTESVVEIIRLSKKNSYFMTKSPESSYTTGNINVIAAF